MWKSQVGILMNVWTFCWVCLEFGLFKMNETANKKCSIRIISISGKLPMFRVHIDLYKSSIPSLFWKVLKKKKLIILKVHINNSSLGGMSVGVVTICFWWITGLCFI